MSDVEKSEVQEVAGFDYRTVIRDPKTGKVLKEQHYKRYVGPWGEFLERDGQFYHPGSNTETIRDPRLPAEEETPVSQAKGKEKVSFSKA